VDHSTLGDNGHTPRTSGPSKWFNPEKGFGFVELSDGSGDGFLHGTVLAQSGISAVQPGDTLEVAIGPGHTSPHVTEVLSVDCLSGESGSQRIRRWRERTSHQ
jgi:CspA family cold shock protein